MIPEDRQDLAALYVLGALDSKEIKEFEEALDNDAELRDLVTDLREAAAALVFAATERQPSAELKTRILRDIAVEESNNGRTGSGISAFWIPWTIAALLMVFCGVLVYERTQLRRELVEVRARDPLKQMLFVELAPQGNAPPAAKAVVAWEGSKQTGAIRVSGLPVVPGKDYQLWAVDADHKDPISAGMLHVDASGVAFVRFKPVAEARHVKAFAITLEREGGVSKAEGPIILIGSTT